MITRTASFATSDGQTFIELEGAQGHELDLLLKTCGDCTAAISIIIAQRDKVIDILTTTPTSKPRARRVNGGTKKRKAATTPELPNV